MTGRKGSDLELVAVCYPRALRHLRSNGWQRSYGLPSESPDNPREHCELSASSVGDT